MSGRETHNAVVVETSPKPGQYCCSGLVIRLAPMLSRQPDFTGSLKKGDEVVNPLHCSVVDCQETHRTGGQGFTVGKKCLCGRERRMETKLREVAKVVANCVPDLLHRDIGSARAPKEVGTVTCLCISMVDGGPVKL